MSPIPNKQFNSPMDKEGFMYGKCEWCGKKVDLDKGDLCDTCSNFPSKQVLNAFVSNHPELLNKSGRLYVGKTMEYLIHNHMVPIPDKGIGAGNVSGKPLNPIQ